MFPKPENAADYKDLLRSAVDAPDVILELPVRYEVKKEKFESRLIVLTQYRLYILTSSKPSGKVDFSYNILDISHVESTSRTSLKLTVLPDSKSFSFISPPLTANNESTPPGQQINNYDFDSFLSAFVYAFRLTFPETSRRPLPSITANPPSRIETIISAFGCVSAPNAAATFSAAYRCSCDRLNADYKPFVAWDVDTIFWMHEDREMALSDFEQGPVDTLTPKDYLPLFSALQYDTWFTSLNLNQSKLTPEIINELCNVLATNRTLTDLRMSGVTGRSMQEILSKIQQTLERCHGGSCISLLDLSGNSVDDKAIAALCTIAGCLSSRLSFLSLARCQVAKNQICQLADAPGLRGAAMSGNLTHLDLSSSACKSDETSQALCNLLSSTTALRHLNLSGTEINLQHLGNALLVGPSCSLASLDLSQNSSAFRTHSSSNSATSQLIKFFQSAAALRRLSLAENRLSTEFLRQMLISFASNSALSDVEADFSSNDLQKTSGAVGVLVEMLPLCSCFSALNFSDNGLDVDFSKLIDGTSHCQALVKLNFAKNVPSAKSRLPVAETLASVLQSAESRLRFLDVSDCRLRQATSTLCAALTDSRLTEIDISGNQMSDSGVVYLAKALQGNTRLKRINIDRNQVTLTGFQVLVSALGKNFTLTSLPTPLADVGQILTAKASLAEKCTQIFAKMEILLSRNRENSSFSGGHTVAKQVFRFQTGCGISENLETLWQMYGEVEHLYMSIQPPGMGIMPSPTEEPVLHETNETLSVCREILRKLSSMTYPMPDISASERYFGEALEQVAKQSFQPVIDHLVQAVEILSSHPRLALLPMSLTNVRQILDQTAQSCCADCHRETSRALTSACHICHYASLFRVLEAITVAVRDRLRDSRLALSERAAKGRAPVKLPLGSMVSSPGSNGNHYQTGSKYGTINRRQRPVSAMTPDVMPSFGDEGTPEESQLNFIYAHVANSSSQQKTPISRRPLAADVFASETPVNLSTQGESAAGSLLSNPCKERPKKPKTQPPSRPVVVTRTSSDAEAQNASNEDSNCQIESNGHSVGIGGGFLYPRGKVPPKSPTPPNNSSSSLVTPVNAAVTRERADSNSGDEQLLTKDQPLLGKTSLTKPVVGGVKVGPAVNLNEFKLKKTPAGAGLSSQGGETSGSNELSLTSETNQPPFKRQTSSGEEPASATAAPASDVSVLRPKPPAKPAKPPKPAVALPQFGKEGSANGTKTPTSENPPPSSAPPDSLPKDGNRPASPPSFSESADAFADRMSRFGGGAAAAKLRREQVARSMIEMPQRTPRPGETGDAPSSTTTT